MSKTQKILAVVITALFIGIFLFKNRRMFFDSSFDTEVDKLWENRHKKAEQPLKKFNDEIFSKIAFSGVIVDGGYSRTKSYDTGGSYWIDIKLSTPLIKSNNTPLKIPNIYDLTSNPIKIYYKPDGVIEGDRVEKKLNENFIKIFRKKGDSMSRSMIYYTTDFDYFWK